jgi:PleD family two-component response regulator
VESSYGSGSCFSIKLPRCDLAEKKQTPAVLERKSAHVLVIEDEKNIREVLDEILSTAGHTVTQATSGEEGIELFQKHKADIVITDLGMSGLSSLLGGMFSF